jgi:hypothetical protein
MDRRTPRLAQALTVLNDRSLTDAYATRKALAYLRNFLWLTDDIPPDATRAIKKIIRILEKDEPCPLYSIRTHARFSLDIWLEHGH